jgi:hypothetical protein
VKAFFPQASVSASSCKRKRVFTACRYDLPKRRLRLGGRNDILFFAACIAIIFLNEPRASLYLSLQRESNNTQSSLLPPFGGIEAQSPEKVTYYEASGLRILYDKRD